MRLSDKVLRKSWKKVSCRLHTRFCTHTDTQTSFTAIRCGGLSKVKSKVIKKILDQTMERYGKLSLDHLHSASDEDSMRELVSFDGVGPKTASCVLLFCLGRESFAVDSRLSVQFECYCPRSGLRRLSVQRTCFVSPKPLGGLPRELTERPPFNIWT